MEMAFCGTSEGTRSGGIVRFSGGTISSDGCSISDVPAMSSATIDGVIENMPFSAATAGWSLEADSVASKRS